MLFEMFGVRAEIETIYRTLLRRPDLTAPVPTAHLAPTPEHAAAIRDELAGHGLLVRDGPGWVVVPPELAVETLSRHAEQQLEARRLAIRQARSGISSAVAEVVDSHRELSPSITETVRGGDAVRARLHQLTQDTVHQVCSINPGPALARRSVEASRSMDRTLHDHGVTQRAIFADLAFTDRDFLDYLREVVAQGDQVRRHPDPPVRLLLFDATVAVVPAAESDGGPGALIVHEQAIVTPLVALFEQSWSAALAPDLDATAAEDDPDGLRIRQVLTMLVSGQPDSAIARQLGISVRTVGRLVAEAGRRLQANSRIEVCLLALRAGWIPDPAPRRSQPIGP